MKPAWDKLAKEFETGNVVIGDVDCTVHQGLCSENGVKGYPTVKWYANGRWNDYQGGRDYNQLKAHAEGPVGAKAIECEVTNSRSSGASGNEGCSKKETKFIEKMKTRKQDSLDSVADILRTCIEKGKGEECRKAVGTKLKLSSKKLAWVKTKLKLVEAIEPMSPEVLAAYEALKAKQTSYANLQTLLSKAMKGDTKAASKLDAAVDFGQVDGLKKEL